VSEYEALVAAGPNALDAIPGAVYVCDDEGWLVRYNAEAAELWGRTPLTGSRQQRFCGSHRLFLLDGRRRRTPIARWRKPSATEPRHATQK
jgi:PAS domain-containing protein